MNIAYMAAQMTPMKAAPILHKESYHECSMSKNAVTYVLSTSGRGLASMPAEDSR